MFKWSDDQQKALDAFWDWWYGRQLSFTLSGGAGTGKTTLTAEVMRGVDSSVYLAPTHRALAVMKGRQVEHGLDGACFTWAKGMNRRLMSDDAKRYLARNRGENKIMKGVPLIIVDEASMAGEKQFKQMMREAKQHGARILFVGDPNQMPPIGEKATWPAFRSVKSRAHLGQVVRQEKDNPITREARALIPLIEADVDDIYAPRAGINREGRGVHRIPHLSLVSSIASAAAVESRGQRVLCWRNDTVEAWSRLIRTKMYGAHEGDPWQRGERVLNIHQVNSVAGGMYVYAHQESTVTAEPAGEYEYEDYPEIVFRVMRLLPDEYDAECEVREALEPDVLDKVLKKLAKAARRHAEGSVGWREGWKRFWGVHDDFAKLTSAYVSTVHSAQGVTLNSVWVDVHDIEAARGKNKLSYVNRLMYVALTRASASAFLCDDGS